MTGSRCGPRRNGCGVTRARAALLTLTLVFIVAYSGGMRAIGLVLCTALLTTTGCANDPPASESGKLRVLAAFYPLAFVSEQVGGELVSVSNLTKSGAEPHDLELSPSQVGAMESAALVVYLDGFQPAVDDAVDSSNSLDVATVESLVEGAEADDEGEEAEGDEHGLDPHVWLDPARLATIASAVGERLAAVDQENADAYRTRAATLSRSLTALDGEFSKGLAVCARREIVTSHAAFGYLAQRYRLTQLGISGLDPEAEPSPARLREVAAFVRQRKVTTIFFETLVSPKVARALAGETGATTAVLDPVEGVAAGSDYFSVMRANLGALRKALTCQ